MAEEKKRGRGRPRKPTHVEHYRELGPLPSDPLAAIEWAGKALAVAMFKTATDDLLDERTRRQELRATAKAMAGLVPMERLLEAERAVRRAADEQSEVNEDPGKRDMTTKPAKSLRFDPKKK